MQINVKTAPRLVNFDDLEIGQFFRWRSSTSARYAVEDENMREGLKLSDTTWLNLEGQTVETICANDNIVWPLVATRIDFEEDNEN